MAQAASRKFDSVKKLDATAVTDKAFDEKSLTVEGKGEVQRQCGLYFMEKDREEMDCISDLPECVIHHIMSFMHPKDAARMSSLSRRWTNLWNSFPVLDCDDKFFPIRGHGLVEQTTGLINHIRLFIKRCADQGTTIAKFRITLRITHLMDLKAWVRGAIERNVREIEIHLKPVVCAKHSGMPSTAFCGNSLSVLSLCRCNLDTYNNIEFPKLRKLCLKKLNLSDEMLQNIISSGPLIEDLRLVECDLLTHIELCTLINLKRFDSHQCSSLKSINIKASLLCSFWFYGSKRRRCKIDLQECTNLKELVLEDPHMTNKTFEEFFHFPLLEKLVLSKCFRLKEIRIDHGELKHLVIKDCRKILEVYLWAQKLLSFKYKGEDRPIYPVITKPKEVELCITATNTDYCEYFRFLDALDRSSGLKMISFDKMDVVLQEDISKMLIPRWVSCKRRMVKVSASTNYLIDSVLSSVPHPLSLLVRSPKDSEYPESIYEKLHEEIKDPKCCYYFKKKCWRHFLTGIKCVKDEFRKPQTSSIEWVACANWRETTFALEWAATEEAKEDVVNSVDGFRSD